MKIQPWHVLLAGGAAVAYGLLSARKATSLTPGTPTVPPSGPGLPRRRPDGSEDFAAMEPEGTCDPTAKPGVVKFRDIVLSQFGGTNLGIVRECGGKTSGHTAGTAWDWGMLTNNAQVPAMLDWLFANDAEVIRRAGIMYVIFNRRIWNTRSRTWQAYTGENPHTDHVHLSFSRAGAMGLTSFYASPPVA